MFTWKFTPDGPEGYCLSTDDKSTEIKTMAGKTEPIPNGTLCLEMDTTKFHAWDTENEQWRPQ